MSTWSASQATAIVFLTGFAIQQALQIFDPFIIVGINAFKNSRENKTFPEGLNEVDIKKAVMAFLSLLCGMIVVNSTDIHLLQYVSANEGPPLNSFGDFFVSSLVIGSGTEAANTFLKYLGYLKDVQKQKLK